jgi:hypothetical protein
MTADVDAEGGVWVTCADLAKRKGISRQAATKRVGQLEAAGKIETRRDGRTRLVDLAAYDKAVGEVGDAVKEQAAATTRERSKAASPVMRDAQTERAQYEARLKALDLAERQGQLLPIAGAHGIEAAASEIGDILARDLDGLVRHAEDILTAGTKDGVVGARRVLKDIANRTRSKVAEALAHLAAKGEEAEREGPIETLLPDE